MLFYISPISTPKTSVSELRLYTMIHLTHRFLFKSSFQTRVVLDIQLLSRFG
jgi:hypothetical protein